MADDAALAFEPEAVRGNTVVAALPSLSALRDQTTERPLGEAWLAFDAGEQLVGTLGGANTAFVVGRKQQEALAIVWPPRCIAD